MVATLNDKIKCLSLYVFKINLNNKSLKTLIIDSPT